MSVSQSHTVEQAAGPATRDPMPRAQDRPPLDEQRAFPSRLLWPLAFGLLGALVLSGIYLGLVSVVESWAHAVDLFREDAAFVVPIVLGFGTQVGLFTYLRRGIRAAQGIGAAGAVTGTSGSTSALGMLACCAHHVTDVLPLLGLSGAAVFLARYKIPFMVAGLLSNAAGIAVLAITIRKAKRMHSSEGACH